MQTNNKKGNIRPKSSKDNEGGGSFQLLPQCDYWMLLNEAFEVLSSPRWRQIYDCYGEEGLKKGVTTPTGFVEPFVFAGDCMKTFKDFFATYSPYADLIDAVTRPPPLCTSQKSIVRTQRPPLHQDVFVDLEELFYGGTKKLRLLKSCIEKDKSVLREEYLTIDIVPGMATGTKICFPGAGDECERTLPADIVCTVWDYPHPRFRRLGSDLYTLVTLDLAQALLGCCLAIDGIDGRRLPVELAEIVTPQSRKVLRGEGLPLLDGKGRGDLHVEFCVQFPKFIPSNVKDELRETFKKLHENFNW